MFILLLLWVDLLIAAGVSATYAALLAVAARAMPIGTVHRAWTVSS
jgi:hypothetical protein